MDKQFDIEIKRIIASQGVNLDDSAVGINEKEIKEENFSLVDLQDALYVDKAPEDRVKEALQTLDPELEALLEELRDVSQVQETAPEPTRRVVDPSKKLVLEELKTGNDLKDKDKDKEKDNEGPLFE
jgi:predicted DNA-binding ArsR family transcriptional regulator